MATNSIALRKPQPKIKIPLIHPAQLNNLASCTNGLAPTQSKMLLNSCQQLHPDQSFHWTANGIFLAIMTSQVTTLYWNSLSSPPAYVFLVSTSTYCPLWLLWLLCSAPQNIAICQTECEFLNPRPCFTTSASATMSMKNEFVVGWQHWRPINNSNYNNMESSMYWTPYFISHLFLFNDVWVLLLYLCFRLHNFQIK